MYLGVLNNNKSAFVTPFPPIILFWPSSAKTRTMPPIFCTPLSETHDSTNNRNNNNNNLKTAKAILNNLMSIGIYE